MLTEIHEKSHNTNKRYKILHITHSSQNSRVFFQSFNLFLTQLLTIWWKITILLLHESAYNCNLLFCIKNNSQVEWDKGLVNLSADFNENFTL